MTALDGSESLLRWVPPAVLDLDELGTSCNVPVNMRGELRLPGGGWGLRGQWSIRKRKEEIVLNPNGYVLGASRA